MIDKRLFKLPKAKIMLAMLAGLMFLQAFARGCFGIRQA